MQAKAYTMTHLLNPLKVIILGADKRMVMVVHLNLVLIIQRLV